MVTEVPLEIEKMNNYRMRKKLFIISLIITIMSFLPQITPFSLAYKGNHFLRKIEHPLGLISKAFLVNDRIFLYSSSLSRIQVYDLEGRFRYGFPINSRSDVRFKSNNFHIISMIYYRKFDLEGNLLQKKKIDNFEDNDLLKEYPEIDYPQLKVVRNLFTSYVMYKTESGRTIKIGTKWYLWLFNVPFPAIIFAWIMYYTRPRKVFIPKPIQNIYLKIMKKFFANRSQI
jgi:hypothetical protein